MVMKILDLLVQPLGELNLLEVEAAETKALALEWVHQVEVQLLAALHQEVALEVEVEAQLQLQDHDQDNDHEKNISN